MTTHSLHPRRTLTLGLPALVAAPWLLSARLATAQARRPTPSQTEGPYYPVALPKDADFDLLKNGALSYTKGEPVWLSGVVTDTDGRPLQGRALRPPARRQSQRPGVPGLWQGGGGG
jgi:protocatechuate 3,4-dioxygenase, beta subunit